MASSLPRARGGLAALPNLAAGRSAPALLLLLPHRRPSRSTAQPVAAAPERSASAHGRTAASASLAVAATWTFGASPARSCSLSVTALVQTSSIQGPPRLVVVRATHVPDRVPPLRKVVATLRPGSEGVPSLPPLSELPEPMLADAIPPLLQWATNTAARAISAQFVIERFFSPGARDCVRAAAAEVPEGRQLQPADLALGALTLWREQPCCGDVLGVLHHCGGLTLERCRELLPTAATAASATAETDAGKGDEDFLSPASQHFIMQAYRWAVFTGSGKVQPCHLLWALSADPRVSYCSFRTDPLDNNVVVAAAWEPPLVGMLGRAGRNMTVVYDKVLRVVQRQINAHTQRAAPSSSSSSPSSSTSSPPSAIPPAVSALHQQLLMELASVPLGAAACCKLIASCRTMGVVLSREEMQRLCGEVRGEDLERTQAYQSTVAFAALGYRMGTSCQAATHRVVSLVGPTYSGVIDSKAEVHFICETAAATLFHGEGSSGLLQSIDAGFTSYGSAEPSRSPRNRNKNVQELLAMADALWAVAQTGDAVNNSSYSNYSNYSNSAGQAQHGLAAYARKVADTLDCEEPEDLAAVLAYIAAASKAPGFERESKQLWDKSYDITQMEIAVSKLPLHLIMSLLERCGQGGVQADRMDSSFWDGVFKKIQDRPISSPRPYVALMKPHPAATAFKAILTAIQPRVSRSGFLAQLRGGGGGVSGPEQQSAVAAANGEGGGAALSAACPDPRVVIWALVSGGASTAASAAAAGVGFNTAASDAEDLLGRMGQLLSGGGGETGYTAAATAATATAATFRQLSVDVVELAKSSVEGSNASSSSKVAAAPSPQQCFQLLVGLALLAAPPLPVPSLKVLVEGAIASLKEAPGTGVAASNAGDSSELPPEQRSALLQWARATLQRDVAVQVGRQLAEAAEAEAGSVVLALAMTCMEARSMDAAATGGAGSGGATAAVSRDDDATAARIRARIGGAVAALRARVAALTAAGEASVTGTGGAGSDGAAVASGEADRHLGTARSLLAALERYSE